MPEQLLISKSDFDGHIDLSVNLNAGKKLNQHILHAQDFDLSPLMGDKFFNDMLANYDKEPYIELLSGGTYVKDEITYNFSGIKTVLVYFSGSRLVKELDLHITPNAIMAKRNEFSDPVSISEKTFRANQLDNTALAYWNKIVKYIEFKGDSVFPYWKKDCGCDRKTGFRPRIKSVGYGR